MKLYLWQGEKHAGGGVGEPPVPAVGEIVAVMELPDLVRKTPADELHANTVTARMSERLHETGKRLFRPCSPATIGDALRFAVIPAFANHEALSAAITVTAPKPPEEAAATATEPPPAAEVASPVGAEAVATETATEPTVERGARRRGHDE